MNSLPKLFLALPLAALLSACAGTNDAPPREAAAPSFESARIEEEAEELGGVYVPPGGAVPPAAVSAAPLGEQNAAYIVSNSHVQVFPLDGPLPQASVPYRGYAAGNESLVTTYPLSSPEGMPGTGEIVGALTPSYEGQGPQNGLGTVYFPHGSSRIDGEGRQVVSRAAGQAQGGVRVEGHASTRAESGSATERHIKNLRMSMKRAGAVSEALIREGVPPDQIKTTALGDARAHGAGSEANARRVDILTGQ